MRILQKIEIGVACALPITALFLPTVPLIEIFRGSNYFGFGIVIFLLIPVFAYTILNYVAFGAAYLDSSLLTIALWLILVPSLLISIYLFLVCSWGGLLAVMAFGAAPATALLTALVSLVSRISGLLSRHHNSFDLI